MSQKIFLVPKYDTILSLRREIQRQIPRLAENTNFSLHSVEFDREIQFLEEEDFTVGALGIPKNRGAAVVVKMRSQRREDRHPYDEAIEKFRAVLERENEIYQTIFEFKMWSDRKMESELWQILESLPTNEEVLRKVENCGQYSKEDWGGILSSVLKGREERYLLQYVLNVVEKVQSVSNKYV